MDKEQAKAFLEGEIEKEALEQARQGQTNEIESAVMDVLKDLKGVSDLDVQREVGTTMIKFHDNETGKLMNVLVDKTSTPKKIRVAFVADLGLGTLPSKEFSAVDKSEVRNLLPKTIKEIRRVAVD